MVDEALRSGGGTSSPGSSAVPTFAEMPTPWGFAARHSPAGLPGFWVDVVALDSGRTGLLLGCCRNPAALADAREAARVALRAAADPIATVRGLEASHHSAVCAVIDIDTIGYGGVGGPCGAVSAPGAPVTLLDFPDGRLAVSVLQPGSTVLFCLGSRPAPGALLDDCAGVHPDVLADRVMLDLAARDHRSTAAVVYRHPPGPMRITLPAEPGSLSVSRGRLRDWLNAAGVDSETCADALLAAGEATANSTEHAVLGASGPVDITVDAGFEPGVLRLSVSDNGRWKPASTSPGHRGHGLALMKALMNDVELTTGPQGTTVTMAKELPR